MQRLKLERAGLEGVGAKSKKEGQSTRVFFWKALATEGLRQYGDRASSHTRKNSPLDSN